MAATGLPHAQIADLTPADVDLVAWTLVVRGRRKGRGGPPSLRPLSPQAVAAFRAFCQAEAWGPFSRGSLYRIFQDACATLGLTGLRPYDLRHSYLTDVYRATGDLRVTQVLAGHSKSSLTERYTLAAVPPQVAAAVAKVERMRTQAVKAARESARRGRRK
jgi:integrase